VRRALLWLTLGLCHCAPSGDAATPAGGDADTARDTGAEARDPSLVTGRHDWTVDGLERSFYLHVPEDLAPAAPLVIVLHGYSGNAGEMRRSSGLDVLAEQQGFVAVFPQGLRDARGMPFWNVGYDFHAQETVDDVAFLRALAARLVAGLGLDGDAVFVTGMSNGGDMSLLMACEASDLTRAVAPVAGTMMVKNLDGCAPSRVMPVLMVNGTADDITLWAGDLENRGGWGAYLGVEEVAALWVEKNDLDQHQSEELPDTDPSDGSTVTKLRWWTDAHDTEVILYRVNGGGHDWPGAYGNQDLSTSEALWGFFAETL
jgi:polyhydroxybutyrate depolymerase